MKMYLFILGLVCLFASPGYSETEFSKTLSLREYWGVQRTQDFVSSGIPLPKGLINEASHIGLFSGGGAQIPFQSRPQMRWPDGSLRWVLLTFPSDINAQTETPCELRFRKDGTFASPSYSQGQVTVTEDGTKVTVSTGTLTFTLRKQNGFNLFDQVWIDQDNDGSVDDEIVSSSLTNGAEITDHFGGTYTSGNDQTLKVKVEESGPLRAIIKVTGNHSNGASDPLFYGYLCRIYAFAGKSYVHVQYSMKNSYHPHARGALAFNGMRLKLQANLSGAQQVTLYGNSQYSASLADSAYVFQPYQFGFSSVVGVNTVQTGARTDTSARALGWMDVSDNNWGVSVGTYEFASNCPKEMHVKQNGLLEARLWPARYEQGSDSAHYGRTEQWDREDNDRFFIGIAEHKTHKLCYYFHAGSAASANSAGIMAAFNHPVVPQMERSWISLTRAVPGEIYPDTTSIPAPSVLHLPLINKELDHPLYTGAKKWDNLDSNYYDSWATFGEPFWRNGTNSPELFENQGTRYFRYQNPCMLRVLEANAWLYADFRQCHLDSLVGFDPRNSLHYWLRDTGLVRDPIHSAPLPTGSYNLGYAHQWIPGTPGNRTEHFSCRDLFTYYLVSGDLKIRDAMYEYTDMMPDYRVWRGSGPTLPGQGGLGRDDAATLSSIWMCSMIENNDTINGVNVQDYFTQMMHEWAQGANGKYGTIASLSDSGLWGQLDDGRPDGWVGAINDMVFCWYIGQFWNDSLVPYIQKRVACWRDLELGANGGMNYYGWAPTGTADNPLITSTSHYRCTGSLATLLYFSRDTAFERKYNLFTVNGTNPQLLQKPDHGYFGKYDLTWHQAMLFYANDKTHFFQNPILTWDNLAVESNKGNANVPLSMSLYPNPFNPTTLIRLNSAWEPDKAPFLRIAIYDIRGKLVKMMRFNKAEYGPLFKTGISWNGIDNRGKPVSSGVYVIKIDFGKIVLQERAVLIK